MLVRRVIIGLVATVLLVFGMLLPLMLPERCPVNRAAFERIEEGMTVAEVEEILGGPPGDYRTLPPPPFQVGISFGPPLDRRKWRGDGIDVEVCFNNVGRVGWKVSGEQELPALTPAERIRWRLVRLRQRLSS